MSRWGKKERKYRQLHYRTSLGISCLRRRLVITNLRRIRLNYEAFYSGLGFGEVVQTPLKVPGSSILVSFQGLFQTMRYKGA